MGPTHDLRRIIGPVGGGGVQLEVGDPIVHNYLAPTIAA
jgi:hypothetical protein